MDLTGFDHDKHAAYVAQGYCPALDHQTYCCLQNGHRGKHVSLYLNPDGTFQVGCRWD